MTVRELIEELSKYPEDTEVHKEKIEGSIHVFPTLKREKIVFNGDEVIIYE